MHWKPRWRNTWSGKDKRSLLAFRLEWIAILSNKENPKVIAEKWKTCPTHWNACWVECDTPLATEPIKIIRINEKQPTIISTSIFRSNQNKPNELHPTEMHQTMALCFSAIHSPNGSTRVSMATHQANRTAIWFGRRKNVNEQQLIGRGTAENSISLTSWRDDDCSATNWLYKIANASYF